MLFLVFLYVGVGLWFLYEAFRAARQTIISSYSWVPPKVKEVASSAYPLPLELEENALALSELGFEPIGVTHTIVMHGQGYAWYYLNATGEIFAELVMAHKLVGFTTWFPDEAMIMSSYPIGENIQRLDFHSRFAQHSIKAIYLYHCEQLEIWRTLHGQPIKFRTISDILAYSHTYRRRYRALHARRITIRNLIGTVVCLAAAISGVSMVALYQVGYDPNEFLVIAIVPFAIILGAFFSLDRLNHWVISPKEAIDN